MIEANIEAFERIIELYKKQVDKPVQSAKRYINTGKDNSIEKEWLKGAKIIESKRISTDLGFCHIKFKSNKFVLFYGIDFSIKSREIESSLLSPEDINSGLLTLIIAETEIDFREGVSSLEVEENILSQHEDSKYNGHSYNDISELFEPISLFLIPNDSVFFKFDPFQVSTYLLSLYSDELILPFNEKILKKYRKLCLELSGLIKFQNLFVSIVSSNFKHCFLELYRCIELLYPIPFISDLYDIMDLKITYLDFSELFEEAVPWKPIEKDAIEALFSRNNSSLKSDFKSFLKSTKHWRNTRPDRFYYGLRNSIVHFRSAHKEYDLSWEQWLELNSLNLDLIYYHYESNREYFT